MFFIVPALFPGLCIRSALRFLAIFETNVDGKPDVEWLVPPTPVNKDIEHHMAEGGQLQFSYGKALAHAMSGLYGKPERLDYRDGLGNIIPFAFVLNFFLCW